ncbi:MAG: rhomboid family intramembrane serine protease [Verrucomicrobiae bacterium]|nr:rhomboid family intramembrane serine protease [Verrucomicrobiae bacterium]
MKLRPEQRSERRWRARSSAPRRLNMRSQAWAVILLAAINMAVFAVQHFAIAGYQKLVPADARELAQSAAEELRSVGSISLALALDNRLHVLGEADRILSEVNEQHLEAKAYLAELRTRQASGAAVPGLMQQIRDAEATEQMFRKVARQLKVLPTLLGGNHEAGGVSLQELREGRVWTLVTHMFVHGSVMHLLLNMIVMMAAGTYVVMCMGVQHFLTLFFSGGLIGAALQISFFPNVYLIGASAGVYAITIAALLLLPEDTFYRFRIRLRPHLAAVGITIVAVAMLIWTLAAAGPANPLEQSVAHLAHLGGIITGWYYVRMLGIVPRGTFVSSDFEASRETGGR